MPGVDADQIPSRWAPAGAARPLEDPAVVAEELVETVERLAGGREAILVALDRRASSPTGGVMGTHLGATAASRRPFAGFDRERAAYDRRRSDLLASHEGRVVVLVGEALIGPFDTEADAEREGYRAFGLGPLYIRRVSAEDPSAVLPPGLVACRS